MTRNSFRLLHASEETIEYRIQFLSFQRSAVLENIKFIKEENWDDRKMTR